MTNPSLIDILDHEIALIKAPIQRANSLFSSISVHDRCEAIPSFLHSLQRVLRELKPGLKTDEIGSRSQKIWDRVSMVDQQTIHSRLLYILTKYEDVRVQNFVPIFACRETPEALLANLTASDEKQSEWVML